MRLTPKSTYQEIFEVLFNEYDLEEIVATYPIRWHSTTPKNFQCIPGCHGCCTTTFFSKQEFQKLPKGIGEKLLDMKRISDFDSTYQVPFLDTRCSFFTPGAEHACSIAQHRPTRCSIYPYKFIVDIKKKAIYIMADCMTIIPFQPPEPGATGTICPGLKRGPSIEKDIEAIVRPFLNLVLTEKPISIPYHFWPSIDQCLHKEAISIYNRLFEIPYPHITKNGDQTTRVIGVS